MAPKFRPLCERFWVAPQLGADDVKEAAASGVALIVNNRPDGEAPGQPTGADIEKAARAFGLDYVSIPIGAAGIGATHLDALEDAIGRAKGPVLAYCRSGMRSTVLRAFLQARAGEPVDDIMREAKAAGYDLWRMRGGLEALSRGRTGGSGSRNE